ncbi:Putative NUDIX hydrolase domain-containing protein [Septoria linicola]|uniref:NUDIX hydrolase domain-containing protein n=1 Tax=Septoria linicola TaxID=215465 RepID=A0A9Q9B6C6_9PEZI|nr:Putative NUDIX hydrolase domain-containing protein [Septoria linicola]
MTTPNVRVGVGAFVLSPSKSTPLDPCFLIGKRKGSHGAGSYALPGGHLEFGETPEECASRELLEETGLKVKNISFLTATNDPMLSENKHYITLFMTCVREDEADAPQNLEPEKCGGWDWVYWSDLVKWVEEDGAVDHGGNRRTIFTPLINLIRQRPGIVPDCS